MPCDKTTSTSQPKKAAIKSGDTRTGGKSSCPYTVPRSSPSAHSEISSMPVACRWMPFGNSCRPTSPVIASHGVAWQSSRTLWHPGIRYRLDRRVGPFRAFLAMTGMPRAGLRVSGCRGMFILFSREELDKVTLRAQPHQLISARNLTKNLKKSPSGSSSRRANPNTCNPFPL